MRQITFDTNILIDIEEKRKGYENILKIIEFQNDEEISINIPAIIASEKLLEDKHITNFSKFKGYVESIGLKNIEFTKPMGYVGLSFIDYCIFGGKEIDKLDYDIHKILFPNIEPKYEDFCKNRVIDSKILNTKWVNAKIDVLIFWCHIYYKKDIFITRDGNFKKHESDLSSLSFKKIQVKCPEEYISDRTASANFSKS